MRLYNLTDRNRIDRIVGRKPRDLLVNGQIVKPGGSIEVPDDFNLAKVIGWINTELLCIGDPPEWYGKAGRVATVSVETSNPHEEGRDAIGGIEEQRSKKASYRKFEKAPKK